MSEEANQTRPAPSCCKGGAFGNPFMLLLVLFLVGAIVQSVLGPRGRGAVDPIPLPPLMVEGWLNADAGAPTRESLLGRYTVVEVWATWCGPCRAKMPKVAELHGRWADRGVAFVGLTSEPAAESERVAGFVESVPGFDWPVGYGAGLVVDQLGVDFIPELILFGPDGRAVWRGGDTRALEQELERRIEG